MARAAPSGDQQVGNPNTTLPDPLRVIITRNGTPVSGKEVTWAVTAGNGSVDPTTGTTGTNGIASTVVTLGTGQMTITASVPLLVAGGLLVGFGTRLGNGCTSGHGVCGLARLSPRSLAAVATFMAAGIATVFVARHLLGAS